MKTILALILAGAFVTSASIPAFAADKDDSSGDKSDKGKKGKDKKKDDSKKDDSAGKGGW
jgi:hypothetical protein